LERRFEGFVPIAQVSQDEQCLRVECVQARAKDIGYISFIDEHRHLRITDGEFAPILNLAVLHGITVSKNAVSGLDPFNDVDELFGNEVTEAHNKTLAARRLVPQGNCAYETAC